MQDDATPHLVTARVLGRHCVKIGNGLDVSRVAFDIETLDIDPNRQPRKNIFPANFRGPPVGPGVTPPRPTVRS
jgi:hypothetical protein